MTEATKICPLCSRELRPAGEKWLCALSTCPNSIAHCGAPVPGRCGKGPYGSACFLSNCALCNDERRITRDAWRAQGGKGLMFPRVIAYTKTTTIKILTRDAEHRLGLVSSLALPLLGNQFDALTVEYPPDVTDGGYLYIEDNEWSLYLGAVKDALHDGWIWVCPLVGVDVYITDGLFKDWVKK